jgi:hypothetical protein
MTAAAAQGLFAALRWAEGGEGARAVLLADPRGAAPGSGDGGGGDAGDTGEAVRDRLFRACSGRVVALEEAAAAEGGSAGETG